MVESEGGEYILELLEQGASVNSIDDFGRTPLIKTLSNYDSHCAEILLDFGADLNFEWESMNSIDISSTLNDFRSLSMIRNYLMEDAKEKITASFIKADANNSGTMRTVDKALHFYVEFNDSEEVIEFLKLGANVDSKDEYGITPLILAVQNRAIDTAKTLIKHGAKLDESWQGQSTIQMAISSGNEQLIALLKEAFAEKEKQKLKSMIDFETSHEVANNLCF